MSFTTNSNANSTPTSSTSSLAQLLTLRHYQPQQQQQQQAKSSSASLCPLTLVEDSLTCPADFILLEAIQAHLASSAAGRDTTSNSASTQPAVLLCAFRQPAAHYTQIARKWGIPLAPLQSAGVFHMIDSSSLLETLPAVNDPNVVAPVISTATLPSAAQLDSWFSLGVDSAASSSNSSSPLSLLISRIESLRSRHSSLLVLIDDAQCLSLHHASTNASANDIEVLDALVHVQMMLADADAKAQSHTTPSTAASSQAATPLFTVAASSSSGVADSVPATPLPSSLVVVTHGDLGCVSPLLSLLRRHASTFLKLSPLHTGYTKEITGVLTAQQHSTTSSMHAADYWTPMQRLHYKLHESHVKISLPGHSSATLQQ